MKGRECRVDMPAYHLTHVPIGREQINQGIRLLQRCFIIGNPQWRRQVMQDHDDGLANGLVHTAFQPIQTP
ncbi:MAG: hypothetical protein AAGG57_15785 [Pseudomonadota bacterium]